MTKEDFTKLAKEHLFAMETYNTDEKGKFKTDVFGIDKLYEALTLTSVVWRSELLK